MSVVHESLSQLLGIIPSSFVHLYAALKEEKNMPWPESRAELLVYLISKTLLLIKRMLFTMQRYIDPYCIREVRGITCQCKPAGKGAKSA